MNILQTKVEKIWITGNKPFYLFSTDKPLYFDKKQRKTNSNITLSFRNMAEQEMYIKIIRPDQVREERLNGETYIIYPEKAEIKDFILKGKCFLTVSYKEFLENLGKIRKAGFKTFWQNSKNYTNIIIK